MVSKWYVDGKQPIVEHQIKCNAAINNFLSIAKNDNRLCWINSYSVLIRLKYNVTNYANINNACLTSHKYVFNWIIWECTYHSAHFAPKGILLLNVSRLTR